jgi:hypothetical protein
VLATLVSFPRKKKWADVRAPAPSIKLAALFNWLEPPRHLKKDRRARRFFLGSFIDARQLWMALWTFQGTAALP